MKELLNALIIGLISSALVLIIMVANVKSEEPIKEVQTRTVLAELLQKI